VELTIDELAAATATTSRRIRSFQTLGLLPRPSLRGRTGVYGPDHLERLSAILRLQAEGFSLESLDHLFRALDAGLSLAAALGLPEPAADPHSVDGDADAAELYGFAELQPTRRRGVRRPLLALVPTTMWDESEAS
jgi:DNA-binding transcriptional MerR regulator